MEGSKKSEGVILDELDSLGKSVDELIGGLRGLRTRLEPVLGQSSERESEGKDDQDKRSYSPLKVKLEMIQTNLLEAICIQNDIKTRLEIGTE